MSRKLLTNTNKKDTYSYIHLKYDKIYYDNFSITVNAEEFIITDANDNVINAYNKINSSIYILNSNMPLGLYSLKLIFKNLKSIKFMYGRIIEITKLEINSKISLSQMFYQNANLISISGIKLDKRITDLSNMFNNCRKLVNIEPFVINPGSNGSHMFYGCQAITNMPDLNYENFNLMDSMFYECTSLSNISNLFGKTLNATSISYLFRNCSSLIGDISNIIFSKVALVTAFISGTGISSVSNLTFSSLSNANSLFYACDKLISVNDIYMPLCINASSMFANCQSLQTIHNIVFHPSFNNASAMFGGCTELSNIPNIDYSNLRNVNSMFTQCTKLSSVNLTLPNVENMANMFSGCTSLLSASIVTNNNNNYDIDCNSMFFDCTSLQELPNLNYNLIYNCHRMFYNCTSLTGDISLILSKADNVYGMFYNTSISSADLLTRARKFEYTFCECKLLTSAKLRTFIQPNSVTFENYPNYNSTFYNCISLTEIPDISYESTCFFQTFYNTSITELSNKKFTIKYKTDYYSSNDSLYMFMLMFKNSKIETINNVEFEVSMLDDPIYNIRDLDIFSGCNNLVSVNNLKVSSNKQKLSLINMFKDCIILKNVNNLNLQNIYDCSYMFDNTAITKTEMEYILDILGYFNTNIQSDIYCYGIFSNTKITNISDYTLTGLNMLGLFAGTSFETVGNLNFPNIIDLYGLFRGCKKLKSVGNITAPNAIRCSESMFSYCDVLETIGDIYLPMVNNIGSFFFNLSKLKNIGIITLTSASDLNRFFYGCTSLETIPQIIANPKNISFMFYGCIKLTEFNMNNYTGLNLSNCNNISYMFYGCISLITVSNLYASTDISNIVNMISAFDNCINLKYVYNINASNFLLGYSYYIFYRNVSKLEVFDYINYKHNMYINTLNVALAEQIINNAADLTNIATASNRPHIFIYGSVAFYNSISQTVKNNAITKGWNIQNG